MNQDAVKKMLLDIERATMDFSVVFTGKKSKKVNGLYKYDTFEILLHNKNFSTDGELVYTAIHEYTHHLEHERILEQNGGKEPVTRMRFHNTDFWARFHHLLEIAEQKKY
jgi:Zn-dependent peptidase ImmA (M78 family)